MESWHLCQVDGGWRIRARVGGQGQHVGWEHFDGEDDEEEVEDEKDDDGGQGQHMGRGRLCQHVASKVSQGNRPDRAALRRRDK